MKNYMEKFEEIIRKENPKREENPFEDETISQEWIRSVEGEKGFLRDNDIYPRLKNWVEENNPKVLVEIGAGQGICSEKCGMRDGKYIGIEPSAPLVKRAKELYVGSQCEFIVGNAYALPIASESADATFSISVWFHLEDLESASKELCRIMKPNGKFLIITANPDATGLWESWYTDTIKKGKMLVGKVHTPINPLSKNIFYQHGLDEIVEALESNGLKIEKSEPFGIIDDTNAFIEIQGYKQ